MTTAPHPLLQRLGILPIIQAPMAGVSTPAAAELVAKLRREMEAA